MITVFDFVDQNVKANDYVLELGCGDKKITKYISPKCKQILTVDAWEKAQPDYVIDLSYKKLPFANRSYDVVLMLDVIEHLDKAAGYILLQEAQRICRGKLLLLTPLKWDRNTGPTNNKTSFYYGNTWNYHRSLWTAQDFIKLGGWVRHQVETNMYYAGVWTCTS